MARRVNKKCLKCSVLDAEEARRLHGAEGDGCWDDLKCHKRRSHYRHRSDRNFKRFISRQLQQEADIPLQLTIVMIREQVRINYLQVLSKQ